jgi:uncharacterized FAD-dependent dehydrogenase
MSTDYDVIIIGAGPAGIFAALEFARAGGLRVLVVEKGKDIDERRRPGAGEAAPADALMCGWGGAGAYSDGKLTLSPEVGGKLADFVPLDQVRALIAEVDRTYVEFGAPDVVHGGDDEDIGDIAQRAALADLQLIPTRIRHLGTDHCPAIAADMRRAVEGKVTVRANTAAAQIVAEDGNAVGVLLADGERISCRYVIAAPGREGAGWLTGEMDRLGLSRDANPVDVGVRVELPAAVMEPLTSVLYEPKLIFYSKFFDDRVRTFCMCPYGEVVTEYYNGVVTVNGHSYADQHTDRTNFALLVSTRFTEPFHEPIAYGKYLASLANLLGGGVIVQRLGDLEAGRRSTAERIARGLVQPTLANATPGDLSFVLPFRHLTGILEMIEALDKLAPGVGSRHTLLYGVEVKFYSSRPRLTEHLETEIANLFAIGDGAGVTRGLVQASASGLVAAREVLRRENSSEW